MDVWNGDASTRRTIAARLGWLDAAPLMSPHVPRLRCDALAARGPRGSRNLPALAPHATIDAARLTLSSVAAQRLSGEAATAFLRLVPDQFLSACA